MKELEVLLTENIYDKFRQAYNLIINDKSKIITFVVNDIRVFLCIDTFGEDCKVISYEEQKKICKV